MESKFKFKGKNMEFLMASCGSTLESSTRGHSRATYKI